MSDVSPTQKIISLEAENVMRLRAVRISPNGDSVVLGGANGAGKSSVLAAIEMAFGGQRHVPDEALRQGERRGRVIVETEDFVVTRTFSKKGSDVVVKAKALDGAPLPAPQTLLNKFFGALTFDPFEFERMEPRRQVDLLKELAGLDFTDLDQSRARLFDARREVGRDLRRERASLAATKPAPSGTPDEEVSVAELASELDKARKANAGNDRVRSGLAELKEQIDPAQERVEDAREALRLAQAALDKAVDELDRLKRRIADGEAYAADLVDVPTEHLEGALASAQETNRSVQAKLARVRLEQEVMRLEVRHDELQRDIEDLDRRKAEAIASAEFPVEGLEIVEHDQDDGRVEVRLNGVPFGQGSQSERLRTSVAIGAAMNPRLRVMLVRDGALFDDDGLRLLARIAAEADMQLFVEVVGKRDDVTVMISDGEVVEDRHAHRLEAAS